LDEFTNGLDTATSEDIARGLRNWCDSTNGSIVSTLQQPTPGLYNTFDNIVILREGQVVFDGPRDDVLPFFEAMGFRCPDDVDVCDFLVDVLSQPRLSIERQRATDKKARKTEKADTAVVAAPADSVFTPAAKPCVSTDEMVAYYKASPLWAATEQALEKYFPTQGEVDASKHDALMPTDAARETYSLGYIMPFSAMLKLVLMRQLQVVWTDKGLIRPRIGNVCLMALIFGYDKPIDDLQLQNRFEFSEAKIDA
jgi:hypothetical protein